MKNVYTRLLSVAVVGIVTSGLALATTDTSNMAVSADVANVCTISAGALAFGTYDPIVANASTDLDQTATIDVTCTQGASATVTLGQGANAAGGSTDAAPARQLSDGGSELLTYSIFSDASRTVNFDNVTGVDTTGTGAQVSITVYGRVDSAQNTANAGSYSDTVVATITF